MNEIFVENESKNYKLRIYKLKGSDKGNLDHEEYFITKEHMTMRYMQLFKYELFALNPTAWERTETGWEHITL